MSQVKFDHIHCRRNKYCKYAEYKDACMPCKYNVNSAVIPKIDNFKPKIPGITFLGEGL